MLPKLKYPEYEFTIPSTGKKAKFRPFTVGEEKILLMANESESEDEIVAAVRNLIDVCSLGSLELKDLTQFDFEYLFLQLRAKSVSPTIEQSYKVTSCPLTQGPCEEDINIQINIEDATVQTKTDGTWVPLKPNADELTETIKVNDTVGFELVYPSAEDLASITKNSSESDVAVKAIKRVWDGDTVITRDEVTHEDLVEFYESLLPVTRQDVGRFLDKMPMVRYEVEYGCKKCDFKTKFQFEGIYDFFALG